MAEILIRGLDDEIVQRLKDRAARNNRSLQAELQIIIERASMIDPLDARATAERIREKLSGRQHSDSADLMRKLVVDSSVVLKWYTPKIHAEKQIDCRIRNSCFLLPTGLRRKSATRFGRKSGVAS